MTFSRSVVFVNCFIWSPTHRYIWVFIFKIYCYRELYLNMCGLNWSYIFSSGTLVSTGTAEEAPPAEETDAQPVKRAAEEEEVGCH